MDPPPAAVLPHHKLVEVATPVFRDSFEQWRPRLSPLPSPYFTFKFPKRFLAPVEVLPAIAVVISAMSHATAKWHMELCT